MKETVAVIGMGVSGAGVLLAYQKALPQHPEAQIEITCFDVPASFGRGKPFREQSEHALNNSRSHTISYDYAHEEDFVEWLQEQGLAVPEYASRRLCGDYLHDRTQALVKNLQAQVIEKRVEALDWLQDLQQWQVQVTQSDGEAAFYYYDRVHLCCGELPSADFYHLKGQTHYIHEPYPLQQFSEHGPQAGDRVAVIGTGLSALDVYKYLYDECGIRELELFSRSNYFPTVRGQEDQAYACQHLTKANTQQLMAQQNGNFTLANFEQMLSKELAEVGIEFQLFKERFFQPGIKGVLVSYHNPDLVTLMQHVMLQASTILTEAWPAMNEPDRHEFNETYHKLLVNLRNPMPNDSAVELLKGVKQSEIRVLAGVAEIEVLEPSPAGVGPYFALRGEGLEVAVDWVVNATGMDMSLRDVSECPLLQQLLDQRMVQVDSAGGLSLNFETLNLLSPRFGEWPSLHGHGVLVGGAIYQNNSTFKIQAQAHRLVKRLLAGK